MPDGPGERFGRVCSEPDRRMRALHRFGLDRHIIELPELAVEGKSRLIRPSGLHQLEPLDETCDERLPVNAERRKVAEATTGRHPNLHPTVAKPVHRRHGRGKLQWIMQHTSS